MGVLDKIAPFMRDKNNVEPVKFSGVHLEKIEHIFVRIAQDKYSWSLKEKQGLFSLVIAGPLQFLFRAKKKMKFQTTLNKNETCKNCI